MQKVQVSPVRCGGDDSTARATFDVTIEGETHSLYYEITEKLPMRGGESTLAATLHPAMRLGAHLEIPDPVCPSLLESVETIQDVFGVWHPEFLHRVDIEASEREPEALPDDRMVGCFFSGGVDSFYSFLRHRDEIDRLIYIHGFEFPLEETELRKRVSDDMRRLAGAVGKPLIEVETNAQAFATKWVDWGEHYFGAMLASVAHLLSPAFRKVYIPSSHNYAELAPWGSHRLTDPMWTSRSLEIVHDGCEATRFEKVRQIARDKSLLPLLRVCWLYFREDKTEEKANCANCPKCLRTMVALRILDALDDCDTFERPLDLAEVAKIPSPPSSIARCYFEESLAELEASGKSDRGLEQALKDCLNERYYRGVWKLYRSEHNVLRPMIGKFKHLLRKRY